METKKKTGSILLAVVVVLAAVCGIIFFLSSREEAYRIIKIYEIDGKATVTRSDKGEIEGYSNMILESGDEVYLEKGLLTLKLDEDKYVYVEEETKFQLVAAGDSANSKTEIKLLQGAITNDIQSPLQKDASYEVHTANSSMSVRGTTFRVEVYYDETGVLYTRVSVFDGKVETQLVFKDGTVSDSRMVEKGKETIIFEDDANTDYLGDATDIDYTTLPRETIEIIIGIIEEGTSLPVSLDYLKSLLLPDAGDGLPDGKEKETKDETGKTDKSADDTSKESDEEKKQDTSPAENSSGAGDVKKADTPEDGNKQEGSHIITFMYDDIIFATQKVEHGKAASVPSLQPAADGSWDFDFSKEITKDTTIYWK